MLGKKNPIKMLVERELTRSILNQTTDSNVMQAFKEYSLDPTSRYKTIPKKFDPEKIYRYYDSDSPEEVDILKERFKEKKFFNNEEHKSLLKKVRQKFKKTKKEPKATTA
jgi:hypothetical protein